MFKYLFYDGIYEKNDWSSWRVTFRVEKLWDGNPLNFVWCSVVVCSLIWTHFRNHSSTSRIAQVWITFEHIRKYFVVLRSGCDMRWVECRVLSFLHKSAMCNVDIVSIPRSLNNMEYAAHSTIHDIIIQVLYTFSSRHFICLFRLFLEMARMPSDRETPTSHTWHRWVALGVIS